jgi:hypothetical protein
MSRSKHLHRPVHAHKRLAPASQRTLAASLADHYMGELRKHHQYAQMLHTMSSNVAAGAWDGIAVMGFDMEAQMSMSSVIEHMNMHHTRMSTMQMIAHDHGIDLLAIAREKAALWVRGDDSLEAINRSIVALGQEPLTEDEDRERRPAFYASA